MKVFFLFLALQLYGLTWSEYRQESFLREEKIREMWQRAEDETQNYSAALLLMGSYAQGISSKDSDIEFAVLIPENIDPSHYSDLLESFYKFCNNMNLVWDINGWHPPIQFLPSSTESKDLIVSPQHLAQVRKKYYNSTFRYALYYPRFFGGDIALYDQFVSQFTPSYWNPVLKEELAKTEGCIYRTKLPVKRLIKNASSTIQVKGNWIKPTIELIQYLCIKHNVFVFSLEESIEKLCSLNVLSQEFGEVILDFFIFAINIREEFGKDFSSKVLSAVEVNRLIDFYFHMLTLLEITKLEIY